MVDQTNSAPDVPSGLVEFREECAVREQSTQARGSSKKTGTEFTWSPDSPSATGHWTPSQLSLVERLRWWNRWPPSFSATWVALWLPVYIEACSHLGRTYCDATCALWICEASYCWRWLLCEFSFCKFIRGWIPGSCFMGGDGSNQWYESPGFSPQSIWSQLPPGGVFFLSRNWIQERIANSTHPFTNLYKLAQICPLERDTYSHPCPESTARWRKSLPNLKQFLPWI